MIARAFSRRGLFSSKQLQCRLDRVDGRRAMKGSLEPSRMAQLSTRMFYLLFHRNPGGTRFEIDRAGIWAEPGRWWRRISAGWRRGSSTRMIVGRLGAEAIGAVGIGCTSSFTAAAFGLRMLLGLDSVVAQAFGAGRLDDGRRASVQGGSTWSCPPASRAPKNSANGFPTSRQDNDLDSRIRDSRPGILSDSRSRAPRPGSDQGVDRSRGARRGV